MHFSYFIAFIVCGAVALALPGCAPTMIVGGTLENTIEAIVDSASLSAAAKGMLTRAKTLGVVSLDRSSIKAADVFETRGGYVVKIDRQAARQGEMTGSERREALANLCKDRGVDVAMLGRVLKTETGNMIGTMFSGRMKTTLNWTMEMLACNSKTTEAFGGTLRVDLGIYNANQAKLEEDIGAELGAKILAAVGPKQSMEMKVEATTAPRPPSAVVENSPKPAGESIVSPAPSNQRIQQRLAELGFSVGPADGVMGKRTTDALKRFQTNNGLSPNGQATAETLEKLMKK